MGELTTFYKQLFDKIEEKDLEDEKGNYFIVN